MFSTAVHGSRSTAQGCRPVWACMPARPDARSDKCYGFMLFYNLCCCCSKVAAVPRLIAHFYRPGAMHKSPKSQLAKTHLAHQLPPCSPPHLASRGIGQTPKWSNKLLVARSRTWLISWRHDDHHWPCSPSHLASSGATAA